MRIKRLFKNFLIFSSLIFGIQVMAGTNIAIVVDINTRKCLQWIKFENTNNIYKGVLGTTNNVEALPTLEMNAAKVLHPDGAGGIVWGVENDPVWTADSNLFYYKTTADALFATGTPLYVESDPIWLADSNLFYYKTTADGLFATGTPLYVESDPIWLADSNLFYYKTQADALFATGTPLYAESDPIWVADSNLFYYKTVADGLFATGTPLYAESDPIWLADSNLFYYKTVADGLFATGMPVYAESDPIWVAISNQYMRLAGSLLNSATIPSCAVSGTNNTISSGSTEGFIGGGFDNTISESAGFQRAAFIGGGRNNTITDEGEYNAIVGGRNHVIDASYQSTIGGGTGNQILNDVDASVIAGGYQNIMQDTIARCYIFGSGNEITNGCANSAIYSGRDHIIKNDSDYSSIFFGRDCVISNANYSAVGGYKARSFHNGAWVLVDSQNVNFDSTTIDQFSARFQNGYRLTGGQTEVVNADGTNVLHAINWQTMTNQNYAGFTDLIASSNYLEGVMFKKDGSVVMTGDADLGGNGLTNVAFIILNGNRIDDVSSPTGTVTAGYVIKVDTNTNLYFEAELDPVWIVNSNLFYYKTTADALFATGTPLYVESDPIWVANSNLFYYKTTADALFATGTPLYVESDPIWIADSNEFARIDSLPTNLQTVVFGISSSSANNPSDAWSGYWDTWEFVSGSEKVAWMITPLPHETDLTKDVVIHLTLKENTEETGTNFVFLYEFRYISDGGASTQAVDETIAVTSTASGVHHDTHHIDLDITEGLLTAGDEISIVVTRKVDYDADQWDGDIGMLKTGSITYSVP